MSRLLSLLLILCSQSAFGLANSDQFNEDGKLTFANPDAACSVTVQAGRTNWGLGISSINHPELGAQEAQQLTDAVLKYGDQIPAGGRKLQGEYTFFPDNLFWIDKITVITETDPAEGYRTIGASFSFVKVEPTWGGLFSKEVELFNCSDAELLIDPS